MIRSSGLVVLVSSMIGFFILLNFSSNNFLNALPLQINNDSIDRESVVINSADTVNLKVGPRIGTKINYSCPTCSCGVTRRKMRIVGGHQANHTDFPWIIALSNKREFICGGIIISKRHILTAAHCLFRVTSVRDLTVSLGEFDRRNKYSNEKMLMKIIKVVIHPKYNQARHMNDIAILKLETEIPYFTPYIQPACLSSPEGRSDYADLTGVVSGWGSTDENDDTPADVLRKVEVPILSNDDCRQYSSYETGKITDEMVCAGYPDGEKDSCKGDSGGPLQIHGSKPGTMTVIGLVSFGRGCGRPLFPGIYTRIESFLPWIVKHTENECLCDN